MRSISAVMTSGFIVASFVFGEPVVCVDTFSTSFCSTDRGVLRLCAKSSIKCRYCAWRARSARNRALSPLLSGNSSVGTVLDKESRSPRSISLTSSPIFSSGFKLRLSTSNCTINSAKAEASSVAQRVRSKRLSSASRLSALSTTCTMKGNSSPLSNAQAVESCSRLTDV